MKFLIFGGLFLIAAAWVAVTLIGVAIQVAVWVALAVAAVAVIGWVAARLKGPSKTTAIDAPSDLTRLPR
ncbi:MAG: hypothetical protein SGJ21_10750 [Alphaproteobacteria bacterium]|nr:hypothetical protein [Alphaproteobacteria bacterium]